jgi:hypothetical protein
MGSFNALVANASAADALTDFYSARGISMKSMEVVSLVQPPSCITAIN